MNQSFIKDIVKRFETYKTLGEKTFAQLEEKDLFVKCSPESNSIAVIVKHLHGNMMSRFTNFLTEDGEKVWRQRDDEFDDTLKTKEEVVNRWNQGWHCVLESISKLKSDDLSKTIYIRTEPLLVYDALLRQLSHYPYHVGQIVFIGKMIRDKQWHSLSIAKGESQGFNKEMAGKI